MLILAGVSINAIVGDNGVLTKTTYASFLSEMSAVEEAVQLWKAGEIIEAQGDEVKAIPANGLCNANDLTSSERLVGEVGYYRVWSLTSTMPSIDILSSADTFNSSFESELVFYPAGVQDLYYLNNDALEIKGNKTYLIDATTGMIFSTTGISLKGVRCYSLNMARAVMNGSIEQPLFAEAEVSGTGDNIAYAGQKYLVDKDGNYIDENGNIVDEENRVENPNGFQIIADVSNDNIYKLYNNGDLYAKGIKGVNLNSTQEELAELDPYAYLSLTFPNEIPGCSSGEFEYYLGYNTIFIIDKNKDVWAWGENNYNKMGLSDNEQVEFSPLQCRKLNIYGEKAKKIFPTNWSTFIVTESGKLYGAGSNIYGELGILRKSEQTDKFELIEFPENSHTIKEIYNQAGFSVGGDGYSFILTTTGNLYFAGRHCDSKGEKVILKDETLNEEQYVLTWSLVDTDTMFPKLNFSNASCTGSSGRWHNSYWWFYEKNICYQMTWDGDVTEISPWDECKEIEIYTGYNSVAPALAKIIKMDNSVQWWYRGANTYSNIFNTTLEEEEFVDKTDIIGSIETATNKIQQVWFSSNSMIVKMTNGECYGYGAKSQMGLGSSGRVEEWTKINELSNISGSYSLPCPTLPLVIKINNTLMGVNNVNLIKRESILQQNWKLIAQDVKYFTGQTNYASNIFALIKNDNCLYIRGTNSDVLGLNQSTGSTYTLTKVTGEGATDEVKASIATGIKSYGFGNDCTFVLTNSGDLLVSTRATQNWSGIHDGKNHPEFVKIMSNVESFVNKSSANVARLNNGDCYWWGSESNGIGFGRAYEPQKISNVFSEAGPWRATLLWGDLWICGNDKVVTMGLDRNDGFTNGTGTTYFSPQVLETPEEIIGGCMNLSYILLGKSGKLYGAGYSKYNGDGHGQNNLVNNVLHEISCSERFISIVGGKGFAIAVTQSGKVYATGINSYGALGRWVGVNRGDSNSRYRTAFTWVECPELEI